MGSSTGRRPREGGATARTPTCMRPGEAATLGEGTAAGLHLPSLALPGSPSTGQGAPPALVTVQSAAAPAPCRYAASANQQPPLAPPPVPVAPARCARLLRQPALRCCGQGCKKVERQQSSWRRPLHHNAVGRNVATKPHIASCLRLRPWRRRRRRCCPAVLPCCAS